MQVVYLSSTVEDLIWFRRYYLEIFPAGANKAKKQFSVVEKLLKQNPKLGHQTHLDDVYEFSIPNIPFSVIYRLKERRIEVLRVWDERSDRT